MTTTKINYPYLAGYLEQSIKSLASALERNGIIKPGDKKAQKLIEQIVEEKIKQAYKAEREFSTLGLTSD